MLSWAHVDEVQQETQYTCAAACLLAVMRSLKPMPPQVTEKQLARELGCWPVIGAHAKQIVAVARKYGFQSELARFTLMQQARALVDRGWPIIAQVTSFNRPPQGHFVVITGIAGGRAYLMDPNTPSNRRVIPVGELDQRWNEQDGIGVLVTA